MSRQKDIIKVAILTITLISITTLKSISQERIVPLSYGDMNNWMERKIEESKIIGGEIKTIYEVVDGETVVGNSAYTPSKSPWGTSSVYAKVSGISKASVTVFPEARDGGYAALIETRIETVKVLGIININVLATGTIFLGQMDEPVTDTKNPMAKVLQGVPFSERPAYVQFDYKFINGNNKQRVKATGFSRDNNIPGDNCAEVSLFLLKMEEDSEGNITAKRVGTAWYRIKDDVPQWINDARFEVMYGDATKHPKYESYMDLTTDNPAYTKNSKGVVVEINEIGWADEDATPTHMLLRFSSGYGGAYIGAPDSKFWIDNVALVYQQ